MLKEYKEYLEDLRNSLIRCGVELPIKELSEYSEIFNLAENIEDILWFYSILEVTGADERLQGFIFPLDANYLDKMRDSFYKEYLEFSRDYSSISVEAALKRKDRRVKNKEISLFDDVNKVDESVESKGSEAEYKEELGVVEDIKYENQKNEEWVSHGIYIEDLDFEEDEVLKTAENSIDEELEKEENFQEHGVFIEDLMYNSNEITKDAVESEGYSEHGKYIEDLIIEEGDEDVRDNSEELDPEDEFSNWNEDSYEEESEWNEEALEDPEDEFANWGGDEEDFEEELGESEESEENLDPEDEFANWGEDSEEESISEELDPEDEFSNCGEDENEPIPEELDPEDEFSNWGEDEDEEDVISDDVFSDEDGDFANWGNDDDEDLISDDEIEDEFANWGDDEDEESEMASIESQSPTEITQSNPHKKMSEVEKESEKVEHLMSFVGNLFSQGKSLGIKTKDKIMNLKDTEE